ncbi:MAG: amino acid permease [Chthoniobacterales bacterium]|nr:amino acid permease [Chthoniobacterales bacterium]
MREKHGIGFAACTALVVANMVGTGVFTSLGFQLAEIPSRPAIMLLWLLGGVLALCGALCYAELSAALPRSGGEYHFLGRIYHPALGFMAGLVSIIVGFAAPCALAAMAFGAYLQGVLPQIPPLAASCSVLVVVTAFHLRTLALSSVFQIVFTVLKIALVMFLSVALLGGPPGEPAPAAPWSTYVFSAPFAVSLMYTLYAYSGWNAATYVLGEVRGPATVIPRALATGAILVTVLYIALNHAFLRAAPVHQLQGELNVAQVAAGAVFGLAGGKMVAAIISAGLISALSAMIWAGPRVAMVLAEDHPRFFGLLRRRNADGIPVPAVVVQSALTLLLLFTATFEQVLVYAQLALLACGFMVVFGLMVLRWREPALPRPFRVPLYPLTPLLFLAISAFAMVYTAASRPAEALCGAGTLLLCLLLYFPARGERGTAT